jgi:hypothetical protein
MKRDMRITVDKGMIETLVSFSIENLPSLRLASGLYCHDMTFESREPRGESPRYSLMVLLGLQRASCAGHSDLPDLDMLWQQCLSRQDLLTAGDLGLALWADARRGGSMVDGLLSLLERVVPTDQQLCPLAGMEIAWMLIGLAECAERSGRAEALLQRTADHLRRRRASSGLYRHDASSRVRRRLPNFATEIYTLLALSTLARHGLMPGAREDAETLAEQLVRLQLPNGGWPWLFDAEHAGVVERYELYTVHQDAMAPMALLDLAELTGDTRWARAALRGLGWSRGANELGVDLLDVESGFVHRSIRRRSPSDRLHLACNAAASRTIRRPLRLDARSLEVNRTCRPYHLGWILEAWAGRRDLGAVLEP